MWAVSRARRAHDWRNGNVLAGYSAPRKACDGAAKHVIGGLGALGTNHVLGSTGLTQVISNATQSSYGFSECREAQTWQPGLVAF